MKYLLDTNTVIALLNLRRHEGILRRVEQHTPSDFGISAIVAHELFYGAQKSARVVENLDRIERLRFEVVEFTREDAWQAGRIRADLTHSGSPIGPYDVLIAGQALARSCTLISRNVREFSRIPELLVENWEEET